MAHVMQLVDPLLDEKLPDGHAEQALAPAAAYWPAGQGPDTYWSDTLSTKTEPWLPPARTCESFNIPPAELDTWRNGYVKVVNFAELKSGITFSSTVPDPSFMRTDTSSLAPSKPGLKAE